jgi:hypothetical protein
LEQLKELRRQANLQHKHPVSEVIATPVVPEKTSLRHEQIKQANLPHSIQLHEAPPIAFGLENQQGMLEQSDEAHSRTLSQDPTQMTERPANSRKTR